MRQRLLVPFAFASCLAAIGAFAATVTTTTPRKPHRFQLLPRDLSLQPMPPQNAVPVSFPGARSFTEEELREPLAEPLREIGESGLTKPRADDAAYFLALFYRKHGFPDVEVRYEMRGGRLVLPVREGRRVYLRRVTFSGNHAIDRKTLYEYMIGGTEERLLKEPLAFPFVAADLQTGVARIRGLYESEGFLDAVIDDASFTFSRDRTGADVLVRIREGRRYTVGTVTFAGNTLFPRGELLKALGEPLTQPYTLQRANTMERNLQFFYKAHGYYQAEVTVASDAKQHVNGRVPIKFTVHPHDLFRFNGITVQGLDRLRADFLPKRFAKLKGEIYDPAKLDETYREMLRTGLFRNLRINSVAQPDKTIRLDLTVEEAKAKELGFSIGASSYEGFILGFRVGDRDFRGRGRPLTLGVDISQRGLRGELLYVDPWLFDSDFSLRTKLYAISRDEEGYSKRESGFRADLTRKVTKNIELGVFLQLENVEITEALIEPDLLGATAYQIGTVGFTQSFDFRDHPINPSRGWIINTALDADTIAGDVAFGRATARISFYQPIGTKMMLALGARGGLIYPLTEVPIDERYFNGGSTTVRSFQERELGPRDRHGYPVGGQAFTVFNAELTFPIRGALQGAVFVDAGNVIAEFENAGVDDMRYAVGLGLRYKLPIGPLRLDYGVNPNPKRDEDFGAFHFSFGFAF
jgi:outer membrane protein assembly complex protein YaeT